MAGPLIAIVGSVNAARKDYEPLLRNVQKAKQAAEDLGRELAIAGYRILVYSSSPNYIECDVVRGYVASRKAEVESIEIHFPQVVGADERPAFVEEENQPHLFKPKQDNHREWQVSFYTSLKAAGGIILLGGAQSALISGLVAQISGIPLVPIATFGGSAQTVWSLETVTQTSEEYRHLTGSDRWNSDSAANLVKMLGNQRKRLEEEAALSRRTSEKKKGEGKKRAWLALLLMLGALTLTVLGLFLQKPEPLLFGFMFFLIPPFAGAAGGLVRTIVAARQEAGQEDGMNSASIAITLGAIAGLITAVLFALAQWASNTQIKNFNQGIPDGLSMLMPFVLVIGFVAGLTLELVYSKLQQVNVVNAGPLAIKEGDL